MHPNIHCAPIQPVIHKVTAWLLAYSIIQSKAIEYDYFQRNFLTNRVEYWRGGGEGYKYGVWAVNCNVGGRLCATLVRLWVICDEDNRNVLHVREAYYEIQFLRSKMRILSCILLLTILIFFVSYIQRKSSKQWSENRHILLAHPISPISN